MEENYEVLFGQTVAGKVQVIRQGLYYRIMCRCHLTGDIVCRLMVKCGDVYESVGVLVPTGDGFGIDKRIPVKRIGEGKMSFCISPRHDQIQGKFVPVYPEEPFAYIARLKEAFLATQNGKTGVMLK